MTIHPISKCMIIAAILVSGVDSPVLARSGPAKVMGGIPAPEVGARIRDVKPELKKCAKSQSMKGTIWVSYEIEGETGKVRDLKVLEVDKALDKKDFKKCVLDALKRVAYGRMPKGRNTRVEYPFHYPMP